MSVALLHFISRRFEVGLSTQSCLHELGNAQDVGSRSTNSRRDPWGIAPESAAAAA